MIRILSISLFRAELGTRMPFRYGIAEMKRLPHVFVLLEAEINGVVSRGIAADHLPPKWFTKDPERDLAGEIDDMAAVIRHAADAARGLQGGNVFDIWEKLNAGQGAWGAKAGFPPLLAHFGTSLMERALIDAFCRQRKRPFHELLHADAFGLRLGRIHPELEGTSARDWLPANPLPSVHCRHTVGLSDPLAEADIPPAEKLTDGLPQSLEACIRRYGLSQFKLKFTSDRAQSVPRLCRILAVIGREIGGRFAASLDGNESFKTVGDFRGFWEEATAKPELAPLFANLLFVEQPFHRDIALGEEVGAALRGWSDRPAIIIDESDAETDSLRRALACGYAGTSHKNCKGVFRGVANACFLAWRRKTNPATTSLMSAEDLTNIGPVALLQDLAVQAALGNESVERNGHHYFRGLSFWPESIQREMLALHGDLYVALADGSPSLSIKEGRIDLHSVNAAPFGIAPLPAVETFPRL
ncbi:MAG: hypothetical protein LV480_14785 [Methylacidiphilales bacterium]|nr:hypothetical protein [Candidatus Methylacidiphilales bacterium]